MELRNRSVKRIAQATEFAGRDAALASQASVRNRHPSTGAGKAVLPWAAARRNRAGHIHCAADMGWMPIG